jgi:hypothetical protein
VTSGSPLVRASTTSLLRRVGGDLVKGAALPAETIIRNLTSDGFMLSAPWSGSTGTAELSFRHNLRNYAVHFSMPVP